MAYGNMSEMEKKLNKADMQAYKNYDNNQYSLIPGLSHKKPLAVPAKLQSPGKSSPQGLDGSKKPGMETIKKNYDRMAKYGLQQLG